MKSIVDVCDRFCGRVVGGGGGVGWGVFFFFQAEDGIRDLVRSRGLGDVYKRQVSGGAADRSVENLRVRRSKRADL